MLALVLVLLVGLGQVPISGTSADVRVTRAEIEQKWGPASRTRPSKVRRSTSGVLGSGEPQTLPAGQLTRVIYGCGPLTVLE